MTEEKTVKNEDTVEFKEFNFKYDLQKAIDQAGYKNPSPVQEKSIPFILEGRDLISQAQTGTGKTAAFGLPLIQMMTGKGVEVLVVAPTRELAIQISDELWKFSRLLNYKTATVYGGSSYRRQIEHVKKASIVVATPGRLKDLLDKGMIDLKPKFVVLDEADEMLNMGFITDIKHILSLLPGKRQTLMFSATMPDAIKKLAKEILKNPAEVKITPQNMSNDNIEQIYYVIDENERKDSIVRLLDVKNPTKSIVFCRTKIEVERVNEHLKSLGWNSLALHGDIDQWKRQEITKKFKSREGEILVATDVAARGLDIKNISHVFNYHIPLDPESYVHRIGRTGRAGKKGQALTLVTENEFDALVAIQKTVKSDLFVEQIPVSKKDILEEQKMLIESIVNQKITDEGRKMLLSIIKKNGGDDNILEKITSFLSNVDDKNIVNLGKSKKEAEKLLKNFEDKSNSKSSNNRKRPYSKNNGRFRNKSKQNKKNFDRGRGVEYKWK